MIRLELAGRQYPIGTSEVFVGAGEDCTINIDAPGVEPRHAVVQTMSDGSVAVHRLGETAEVQVNGVALGGDPTPLLHGDRITIGGQDILVVEAEQVGSTQHIDVAELANLMGSPEGADAGVLTSQLQDGRLICLTDGREYSIGSDGVFFGRDATSDIVVLSGEVSRRHAQILPTPQGYVINDSSTNGTFVNKDRIEGSRVLNRSDVIGIGADEFRFYAESASPPVEAPPSDSEPAAAPAPEPAPAASAAPPPGAAARLNNTMMGLPAFVPKTPSMTPGGPADSGKGLATLLVRKGELKGERFVVRVPIANIGRADYNDVVVADESVSQAHAKLQRREEIWVLTDLGSTNGTFVDGQRITDDVPLSPGATITFGEVPVLFDPADEQADIDYQPGTKVMQGLGLAPAPPAQARGHKAGEAIPSRPAGPKIVATPTRSKSGRWWLLVIVVVAAAAAYYFLRMR